MRRTEDSAVPICHHQVITVYEAIGTRLCEASVHSVRAQIECVSRTGTQALLALFQLFQ